MPTKRLPVLLTDEELKLVGLVVIHWSYVESALARLIGRLLSLSQDDILVWYGRHTEDKIKKLRSCASSMPSHDQAALLEILDRVKEVGEERHSVSHGVLAYRTPEHTDPVFLRLKTKRVLPVSAEWLEATIDSISDVGARVQNFQISMTPGAAAP